MSVKIRPYRRGGWEIDIRVIQPDGTEKRERRKAPVASHSAALRWGSARERELIVATPIQIPKEVPTLAEFAPRFLDGYARANRQKPSGIAAKETILRVHLLPALGTTRLDRLTNEDVQRLKSRLVDRSAKTVNNVLSVFNTVLKVAVSWQLIEKVPCTIRLLRTEQPTATFLEFGEYERLLSAAERTDPRAHLIALLGGDAGLRCGEMMALEWGDIDLAKRQLWVHRSDWKGHVTPPKSGRSRCIPLTRRLGAGLRSHRHLRGQRVLCQDDGQPLTQKLVRGFMIRSARRALLVKSGVHLLRHTFCSHLAMRGAPGRAIQELAGHKDLTTSQRYMHLSPAAIQAAIQLLERPTPDPSLGDILETGGSEKPNSF